MVQKKSGQAHLCVDYQQLNKVTKNVAEQDIPKTDFVTKYGPYEFTKILFGLSTAPEAYEHLMELTLLGLQWSLCLIYLDDVIVLSHEFEEQIDRLDKVLT